jgi:thiazole/oxazole-forming peptide maturase SagD family component
MVNPALGPVVGLAATTNDVNAGMAVARAENVTDLRFFGRAHVKSRGDYVEMAGVTGERRGPMSNWIPSGSKGETREQALLGSLGEYLERYSGAFDFLSPGEEAAFGSYREVTARGELALGPQDLTFFHPSQFVPGFTYEPFTEDTPLLWTRFTDLVTRDQVLVPGQIAFLSRHMKQGEKQIAYSTTGGLAFGRSIDAALTHGLLEYIERDSINLCWISGTPAWRIVVDDDRWKRRIASLLGGLADDLTFVRVATDVPGVFVVAAYGTYGTSFMSGAGADLTFEDALMKPLGEIMQCFDGVSRAPAIPASIVRNLQHEDMRKEDLWEFALVLPYYSNPKKTAIAKAWLSSLPEVAASELARETPGSLRSIVEHFRHRGQRVLVKVLEPETLGGTRGRLVRSYLPSLIPAHVPNCPFLGNPRYYRAPIDFGYSTEPLRFDQLNLDEPVPLP